MSTLLNLAHNEKKHALYESDLLQREGEKLETFHK